MQLLNSTEDYLAAGDYAAAYEKAKPEEKEAVLKENLVAVLCADVKEYMKVPDSFDLRKVWCDLEKILLLLKPEEKIVLVALLPITGIVNMTKTKRSMNW